MSSMQTEERVHPALHSIADTVEISPGVAMPRLGLGTSQSYPGQVEQEIEIGFSLGFRLVDTAAAYRNEAAVGRALRATGLPRSEYFVTTKLWNNDQGYESTLAAFEASRARLGLEYIDLYLIHWPQTETTAETWRAFERLHGEGAVRAIGVSNFMPADLDVLMGEARVAPAVDQFELHPWRQRPSAVRACRERGITVQAWAPLMRGHVGEVRELVDIGRKHGKSPAQVALRWILQRGFTTIPKTVHESRLRENADVFDFELTADEMDTIAGLDRGLHAR